MQRNIKDHVCEKSMFSALFNKHSKNLHDYLFYKFGSALNPSDKVQEAFIKLWENCANVSPAKAKAYIYTIANNLMLNDVKHQKVVLAYKKIKPRQHTNETPEFLIEETQYMEKLQKAISELSEAQRTAFLLNRIEGKKHKEIAEMLNISTKAVEKRIYGALNKLRQTIKEI